MPLGDPDYETVYLVPGADAPPDLPAETTTDEEPPRRVVIPPSDGGQTDLASVPSLFWWLVASYGNHTRAALLHDALYVKPDQRQPVPRRTADRLFLAALREPEGKKGAFRHWLMWVAVSLFGTMRRWLGGLFAIQVLTIWSFLIWAVTWAWAPSVWAIRWTWWQILIAVVAVPLFLFALGTAWRAGVDLMGGWLVPDLLVGALIFVPLGYRWTWPPKSWPSPFTVLLVAGALMLLGLLWGGAVDPRLRMWLWPTGLIGLPVAALPIAVIVVSIAIVWFIDLGAAIAAAPRKDPDGNRRGLEIPALKTYRLQI